MELTEVVSVDSESGILILPSDSASLSVPESVPSDLSLDLPNPVVVRALLNGLNGNDPDDDDEDREMWEASTTPNDSSASTVVSVKITPRRLWIFGSVAIFAVASSLFGIVMLIRDRNNLKQTVLELQARDQAKFYDLQKQLDKLKEQATLPTRFTWQEGKDHDDTVVMDNCWANMKVKSGICTHEAKKTAIKYWGKFKDKVSESYEQFKQDYRRAKEQYERDVQERAEREFQQQKTGQQSNVVVMPKKNSHPQSGMQATDVLTGLAIGAVGGLAVAAISSIFDNKKEEEDSPDPFQSVTDAF